MGTSSQAMIAMTFLATEGSSCGRRSWMSLPRHATSTFFGSIASSTTPSPGTLARSSRPTSFQKTTVFNREDVETTPMHLHIVLNMFYHAVILPQRPETTTTCNGRTREPHGCHVPVAVAEAKSFWPGLRGLHGKVGGHADEGEPWLHQRWVQSQSLMALQNIENCNSSRSRWCF